MRRREGRPVTKEKPATERQRYLLDWVNRGLVKVSVWPHFQSWLLIRSHSYYRSGSENNPSEREGRRLIDRGWVELVIDPHHWTEDTITKVRTPHYRAKITDKGKAALGI